MSHAADKRQLQRVAAGEVHASARGNATLDRLELRGLIKRWPDAPAALTAAGRAALQGEEEVMSVTSERLRLFQHAKGWTKSIHAKFDDTTVNWDANVKSASGRLWHAVS